MVTDDLDDRCSHCGALVRAGSPWCSLCYADLRPPAEPLATALPVSEPSYAGSVSGSGSSWSTGHGTDQPNFDPLTAPLSVLEALTSAPALGGDPLAAGQVAQAPAVVAAPVSSPSTGWPCTGCHAVVALDLMTCPNCGTGFLAGSTGEPDLVARLGDGGVSKRTQALIMIGGSLGIVVLVIIAMYVVSLVL